MLNSEGANGPVDQRDDYKEAKKKCDRLHRGSAATAGYVNIRSSWTKDQNNNSKDMERILTELIQKQDGHIIFLQLPRVLLRHLVGDHPTACGQHGIGTLHHGTSNKFFSSRCANFRLQAIAILV